MSKDLSTDNYARDGIPREQISLAMKQLPTMQASSFIVALVLSYIVRDIVPHGNIFTWVLLILSIVASRIVMHFRFSKVHEEPFAWEYWHNIYLILALISGIFWGLSAFLIFPAGNPGLISLFVLVIASLSAATTVSHSSIRLAPTAWAGPAMLLYAIRCFTEGGGFGYTLAFLIVLYLFTILRYSFNHHTSITSAISLRFENLALLDEVRQMRDVLETMVEERTFELKRTNEMLTQEIQDRRIMEDVLRQQEERYRLLMQTSPNAITVMDISGIILMANERALSLYREPDAAGVIGHNVFEWVPQEEREKASAAIARTLASGLIENFEIRLMKHKREPFWASVNASVVHDGAGNPQLVIIVTTDLTDEKKRETELLRAQKLESLGVLAGGIAHDFNNLLQGVYGCISLAKLHIDRHGEAFTLLEQAERALNLSVNLTTQLLTFSKGGKPVMQRIALLPVIEDATKFALSGSRIDYSIQSDKALWMVEADSGQISQVIQNIVINADQSMPLGGTIIIRAMNVPSPCKGLPLALPEGPYVEISFEDRGIGIPEQHLSKIFDPYFTTKDRGSGLGLATVYSIIKNHGGMIDVKSELGRGSTFHVYLPAMEGEKASVENVAPAGPALRPCRILVMDDDALIRNIAGAMIGALGHEVDYALNGEEAIAKYRDSLHTGRRFDIVILDLTIPGGMGGEEAIKALRQIDPNIKAVVSSGYADSAVISEYKNHGFSAYLTKPYNLKSLNNTLTRLLANSKSNEPSN